MHHCRLPALPCRKIEATSEQEVVEMSYRDYLQARAGNSDTWPALLRCPHAASCCFSRGTTTTTPTTTPHPPPPPTPTPTPPPPLPPSVPLLQSPLQPLQDNLESQTYETFERDATKYSTYEEAVYRCLLDRVPQVGCRQRGRLVASQGPRQASRLTGLGNCCLLVYAALAGGAMRRRACSRVGQLSRCEGTWPCQLKPCRCRCPRRRRRSGG